MYFLVPIFLLGMGLGTNRYQESPPPTPVQEPVQSEPESREPATKPEPPQGQPSDTSPNPTNPPGQGETEKKETGQQPASTQPDSQGPATKPEQTEDQSSEPEPEIKPGQGENEEDRTDPSTDRPDPEGVSPTPNETDTASGDSEPGAIDPVEGKPGPVGDEPSNGDTLNLPPIVDYDFDVRLDPESKKITGRVLLLYTNHAPDIIGDLQFHIYPNAFKNNRSAYFWANPNNDPDHWGYITIRHASVAGTDRTGDMEYVQARDAPPGDRTVMRIPLLEPLMPGETVSIELDFETRLPEAHDRSGYGKDFFFAAQWFPKIGVWETKGRRGRATAGWNCHAFHHDTEFYADFGRYKVALETPPDYVVGGTGVLKDSEKGIHGTRHIFEQDRVHDFAFVAGKRLIPKTRRFLPSEWITDEEWTSAAAIQGIQPEELTLPAVDMILLIQPENENQSDRHFDALAQAIKYFGLWFGPYPYDVITMVDPPRDAQTVGGMEYPTLITLGAPLINPKSYLDLEEVIIHEFAHQYWYGMVGTNEFEESWMDEGLATYCTGRLIDILYGPAPIYFSPGKLGISAWELTGLPFYLLGFSAQTNQAPIPVSRLAGFRDETHMRFYAQKAYMDQGTDQIMRDGWAYFSTSFYALNSYYKPAAVLWQLEHELGSEVMARALRAFFRKWAFNHPGTEDFIETVETVSGRDLRWFFDELFFKPGFLDYEVAQVGNVRVNEGAGYRNSDEGPVLGQSRELAVHPSVVIRNLGTIRYPVDILITFEGGRTVRKRWRGDYPWVRYNFYESEAVTKVVIDPDGKIIIDGNRANNSFIVKPEPAASRKWYTRLLVGAQQLLQTLAGGL